MSRLIKKSIAIVSGVQVTRDGDFLVFKGPKGERRLSIPSNSNIKIEADKVWLAPNDEQTNKAMFGTIWSLIQNCIKGVAEGFSKTLDIEGVGYRAVLEGKELVLFLGYVNPVRLKIPEGIVITVEKSSIGISGFDKDLVGRMASEIRSLKKPEPYKGKGIRYRGEVIRRKVGKKAGATATA